ncbi:hypothetical protein VTK26DRAFT_2873 [Humicola hyalothermophila]
MLDHTLVPAEAMSRPQRARSPEPRRQREPLPELPLHAAMREAAALGASLQQLAPTPACPPEALQVCQPAEVVLPSVAAGPAAIPAAAHVSEVIQISPPQAVPVSFPAPAPEPTPVCLPVDREIDMADAPDLVQDEVSVASEMDVDTAILDADVDMVDAVSFPFSLPAYQLFSVFSCSN